MFFIEACYWLFRNAVNASAFKFKAQRLVINSLKKSPVKSGVNFHCRANNGID